MTTRISSYLTYKIDDIIQFSNSIMSDQARNFGEKHLRYKLEDLNKTGTFGILNNIGEYVSLV